MAVHYQSVTMSHPALPIFVTLLGAMPAMSNGVKVNLWGKADPLALVVLNINHSQSRKSRVTGMCEQMVRGVDKVLLLDLF